MSDPTEEDVLDRGEEMQQVEREIARRRKAEEQAGEKMPDYQGEISVAVMREKIRELAARIEALRQLLADEKQDRRDYEDLAELNGEVADTLSAEVTRLRSRIEALEAERDKMSNALSDIWSWTDEHGYEQPGPDPRGIASDVADTVAGLLAERERLREVLEEIRDHPHKSYEMHMSAASDPNYKTGVADGHRCASKIARRALEEV